VKNVEKSLDAPPSEYEFGDFRLDTLQRRLSRRDGTLVALTPRLAEALLFFVERPGQLLDKNTLMDALWPGLVVEENNLSQTISALRRALGDESQDSRFIQTVPRRGFRWVAEVRKVQDAAARAVEPSPGVEEPAPAETAPSAPSLDAAPASAAIAGTESPNEGSFRASREAAADQSFLARAISPLRRDT
jgi:DNA-binding winged helix-turn-helix (wHTH) protein